jgi:rubrerythrin
MKRSVHTEAALLLEPVKQAIMLETQGLQFYRVAAERCSNPVAREMFEALAKDEEQHRAELEHQFRSLLKQNKWSPPATAKHPDLKFRNPIIDQSLKKNIDGAWFDFAALQIGVILERRALAHYKAQASKAETPEPRGLFTWLSKWEEGHLDRLMALEKSMREAIWNDAGFWPLD